MGSFVNKWQARRLSQGQTIAILSTRESGAVGRTWNGSDAFAHQILAIEPSANEPNIAFIRLVEVVNVATDVVAGDWIIIDGSRGGIGATTTDDKRFEIMGVDGAINDQDEYANAGSNTFQGITSPVQEDGSTVNASGVQSWAAHVDESTTSRPLDDLLVQKALDAIEIRSNGFPDKILTGYGARLKVGIGFQTVRRNVNTNTMTGATSPGFKEDTRRGEYIEISGRPVIPCRFLDPSLALVTDWKQHCLKFWARFQWWDGDGSVLRRAPDRSPAYEAEHRATLEYMMRMRNAHARIENVQHDELSIL